MPERLDNRHEIDLAEGISVHLRPASIGPRVLARLIDGSIIGVFYFVLSIVFTLLTLIFRSFEISQGIWMLVTFVVLSFYDVFFELMKTPATPGKRIMKLRVLKLSGAPTNFASSFIRILLLPMEMFLGGTVAIMSILLTKHSQRLGDLAAGTLVVHHIEGTEIDVPPSNVPEQRPNVPLSREEKVAFLEFGRRWMKLSEERQVELTECLENQKGKSASSVHYALGIAHWLQNNEN